MIVDHTGERFGHLVAKERLSRYKGGKTYYRCICDCGEEHIVASGNLVMGKSTMCVRCGRKKPSQKRIDQVGEKFGLLTVEEMLYGYKGKSTYVRCKCVCGNNTVASFQNVRSGKTVSCGCFEKESRFGRKNHEKNLVGMRFGLLTVLKKTDKRYQNGSVGWLCKCDCGNKIVVRSGNLLRGKTRSCGCNKTSKYESWVKEELDAHNIAYMREYAFDDCRNVFRLRFDFYLPDYNICIECQGQQHYHPVDHFGGQERFDTVRNNDKIKECYCNKHNIALVRLPYTLSEHEMKKEISNILNPCND